MPSTPSVQLIRSSTTKVRLGGKTFLVDPMLGAKGSFPGFPMTERCELANPLVDLPMTVEAILADVDAVIVSHTHTDHWDEAAQQLIPKDMLLFAQHEADAELIRSQGFTNVRVLAKGTATAPFPSDAPNLTLTPTGGQHGCCAMYAIPELAEKLGLIMGIVFACPDEPTIYVVGDTIWREEVEAAIAAHKPAAVVLYAGYAMLQGFGDDSIIMGKEDTVRAAAALDKAGAVCAPASAAAAAAPPSKIIAVHLEAINHCMTTRAEVRAYAEEHGISGRVFIPLDGEVVEI